MSTGWLINTTEQEDRDMVKAMFNISVPLHCVSVFINAQAKAYVYTVEIPPHMQYVHYKEQQSWSSTTPRVYREYYLSWPRTIVTVAVRYNKSMERYEHIAVNMFRIKEPFAVMRGKTPLYILPMCNVHAGPEVPNMCVGSTIIESKKDSWDAADKTFTLALNETIWTESINGMYHLGGFLSIKDWHEKSILDPNLGEKMPLTVHPRGYTAAESVFKTLDKCRDFWHYAV